VAKPQSLENRPASRASSLHSAGLQSGPVALYAQLAGVLRDRIVGGQWKTREEIPTLEQLVDEFAVARITVRQAVRILVDEGLLVSQRGRRTTVTFKGTPAAVTPLFSSTAPDEGTDDHYAIQVLSREAFNGLPPQCQGPGTPAARYMRIRKLDSAGGAVYVLSDNFVAMPLFESIPAGAEAHVKISRLVRDHARPPIVSGHERIAAITLDYDQAMLLQAPIGSAAALVTRVFLDADGRIAYYGQLVYRGDRFLVERDISALVQPPGEGSAAPARRPR